MLPTWQWTISTVKLGHNIQDQLVNKEEGTGDPWKFLLAEPLMLQLWVFGQICNQEWQSSFAM